MENILLFGKKFKVKISIKVVCFAATHRHNSLIRFFTLINTFFSSNNAIFNTITHTHFFTPLMTPPPLPPYPIKIGIQGNNLHISLWQLKTQILKKKFFRNLKILKLGVPKTMMPKSQAKIRPSFSQYPF